MNKPSNTVMLTRYEMHQYQTIIQKQPEYLKDILTGCVNTLKTFANGNPGNLPFKYYDHAIQTLNHFFKE